MSEFGKKTISLKSILHDLQMEMDESEIKRKYGLNDRSYQLVIERLSERGLLKRDHQDDTPKSDSEQEHGRPEDPILRRCPACGMAQAQEYDECPHCGVIVSKFSAAASQIYLNAGMRDHRSLDTEPKRSFRTPIIIFSVVVALVVGGVMFEKSGFKLTKDREGPSASIPTGVQNFTQANFEREVKEVSRTTPVLVTFYADW